MAQFHKDVGQRGESLVQDDYLRRGYDFVESNFTMPGGELDLIFLSGGSLVFVEVKVVNHIDELHGYVTKKKLHYLRKTIDYFLLQHATEYKEYAIRLDVVFVRGGSIVEVFENVWVGSG